MKLRIFALIFAYLIELTSQDFVGKPRGGYLSWRKHKENSFKVICYMTNWAQYRPNATKYTPSHIDPHLCTHLIYAFAAINVSNHEIKAFEWNDESKEDLVGRYEEFNLLKLKNPNLKTLLAVGGWNMGSKPFSDMSKNDTYRHTFIRSAVKLLRAYKFDGLGKREGSRDDDKNSFTLLVRDLREAFYNEAMATRQEQLLLSAAVAAEKYTILKAYDIENIVAHLDFISIMSYDYHGSWDKKAGHNSPLYSSQSDTPEDKRLTVDWTVRLYLTLGVPLEKLILGVPFYGRSFTLKNKNSRAFNSETSGDGEPGESTRESGFLSYFETCRYVKKDNWTRLWSREHQAPYAYKANQWVGYDDEESIRIKVNYVIKYCLGGAMVWSIDLDDFKGFCADKPYPLTRIISGSLKERDRKMCTALKKIENDWDVKNYLDSVVKWVPGSSIEQTDEFEIKTNPYQWTTTTSTKVSPTTTTQKTVSFTTTTYFKPSVYRLTYPLYKQTPQTTLKYYTSKNPIYEIDNKAENLNQMLFAYQNSVNPNDSLLDQILQQFLTNITRLQADDPNNQSNQQMFNQLSPIEAINSQMYRDFEKNIIYQNKNQLYQQPIVAQTVMPQEPRTITIKNVYPKPTTRIIKEFKLIYACERLEDGEFVRDPNDCASFFTCFMGKVSKKTTCDSGLAFDYKLKVCNWKSQVDC